MSIYDNTIICKDSPLLIVITGPSGVGKDTVIKELRIQGTKFHLAITATTRPARLGEQDGIDYFFYRDSDFRSLIKNGSLIEYAIVYGHYKGIPRNQIEQALSRREDVVIKPDVAGALRLQKVFSNTVLILLVPESLEQLSTRLKERGTESAEEIIGRVSIAQFELSHRNLFDYVIVNREGQIGQTASYIEKIIRAEKRKAERIFVENL